MPGIVGVLSWLFSGVRAGQRALALFPVLLILFVLLFHSNAAGQKTAVAPPAPIEVQAKRITAFEPRSPQQLQFGQLRFRGGLELKSSARDFGGISSIRVRGDGSSFLAVTDKGFWLRGKIVYDGNAPAGIEQAEMAPLLGPDGRPLQRRGWHDAESLTEDGETVYVGIERVHQIVRFDFGKHGLLARGQPIAVPPEFKSMPRNAGIEALLAAPRRSPLAGTLIAVSEKWLDADGNIGGFLIGGKTPGLFAVRRTNDFDVTDAALHGADVLILERKFSLLSGPGMRIRSVPLASFKPGALLDGPTLIEADFGHEIDNMEGLSVHETPAGEVVFTLVSDDNFSALQRTLLLQFTLEQP